MSFGSQFEFLRFQLSNWQSIDDASTLCSILNFLSNAIIIAIYLGYCKITHLFWNEEKKTENFMFSSKKLSIILNNDIQHIIFLRELCTNYNLAVVCTHYHQHCITTQCYYTWTITPNLRFCSLQQRWELWRRILKGQDCTNRISQLHYSSTKDSISLHKTLFDGVILDVRILYLQNYKI